MAEVPFRLAHQLSKKEKGPLLAGKKPECQACLHARQPGAVKLKW